MTRALRIPLPRDWFRAPDFAGYELLLMRLLFAVVLWDILPAGVSLKTQPSPVGLGHWIDFTFFANPGFYRACKIATALALVVYVVGRWLWIALPAALFVIVGIGTLAASQGSATHSTTIVALILLVQTVWYVWAKISGQEEIRHPRAAFMSIQTIAAAYVISAFSKIAGEGNWLRGAIDNYPLQMVKTARQNYYNTLEESTSDPRGGILGLLGRWLEPVATPMTELLLHSPFWRGVLLGSGFLLELLAFLALIGRKSSALVGLALVGFHFAIYLVMGLKFQYNMAVALIFLVNVPFWTVRRFTKAPARGAR